MTEQEITGLGPAFAAYLGRYRGCFLQKRTAAPTRSGSGGKNPLVTAEQVCRALNQRCGAEFRRRRGVPVVRHTSQVIRYHQRRNAQSAKSYPRERYRTVI